MDFPTKKSKNLKDMDYKQYYLLFMYYQGSNDFSDNLR